MPQTFGEELTGGQQQQQQSAYRLPRLSDFSLTRLAPVRESPAPAQPSQKADNSVSEFEEQLGISDQSQGTVVKSSGHRKSIIGALAFVCATGIAYVGGFAFTFNRVTKPGGGDKDIAVDFSGVRLARRALAWGTLYSVAGVGLLTAAVAVAFRVTSPSELRHTLHESVKPHLPVHEKRGTGRTEFESFRELFEYLANPDDDEAQQSSADPLASQPTTSATSS